MPGAGWPKAGEMETLYDRIRAGREALYFLHVPRTGGTSTTSVLDVHFHRAAICPWQTSDKLREIPREQWRGYQLYRGHFGLGFRDFIGREPLYMTMLRHPADSAISAYFDSVRNGHFQGTTLEQFASTSLGDSMSYRFRKQLLRDPGDKIGRRPDDETVAEAIANLEAFTFVGCTDQFDLSVQTLAHTMGWQHPPATPRRNHTHDKRKPYTDEVRALVEERVAAEVPIYLRGRELLAERHRRMMNELLDGAHRRRVAAMPRVEQLDLDLDGAIPGTGWHEHEALQGPAPLRWSGPGNEATVDVPLRQDRSYELLASVSQYFAPQIAASLELLVNDHPVRTHVRSVDGTRFLLVAHLPVDVLRMDPELTRLRFRWQGTYNQHRDDPSCTDDRELGVCFHQLVVAPKIQIRGDVSPASPAGSV